MSWIRFKNLRMTHRRLRISNDPTALRILIPVHLTNFPDVCPMPATPDDAEENDEVSELDEDEMDL